MRLRPALARLVSAAGVTLAACALAASGVAHAAADLNVIRAVDVKDEGGTIVLTVNGSRPPNFTTFSMADPPRFVIDLSESRFQGVPEDLVVQDGVVNVVKNLSYGSDATSIARVMVAFLVDVDPPEVQAAGNALVVRVTKPAGVGVAAAPAAKAAEAEAEQRAQEAQARADAERDRLAAEAQAAADKAQAQADAEKAAQTQAAAEKAAQVQAEAEKAAQAEADKAAQAQAAAEKAAQAQAEAEKAAQAEAARLAAEAQAQARAAEEAKAKVEVAQASADRDAEPARKDAGEQIARAEAEKAAREEEERRAREAYEAERQAALAKASAPAALQAAAEPTRGEVAAPAETADPAPAREPQADAEPLAERELAASAAPAAEPEAAPLERPLDAAPAQETALGTENLAASALAPAPSAQLREVGFRQLPGSSRVFFRTSVTPRFSVQDVGENVIRVELENTRAVRRNDTRFLDTSFFSSAVAMVTPRRQGTSYVVEIKLRERVPYQQRIEGDMLALDFARPAAIAAGPGAEPAADPAAQPDPLSGEGAPLAPVAAPAN